MLESPTSLTHYSSKNLNEMILHKIRRYVLTETLIESDDRLCIVKQREKYNRVSIENNDTLLSPLK